VQTNFRDCSKAFDYLDLCSRKHAIGSPDHITASEPTSRSGPTGSTVLGETDAFGIEKVKYGKNVES